MSQQPGFSPAGRLFRLLQRGMNINGQDKVIEAAAKLLGADTQDKSAALASYGEIAALVSDARKHVQAHPDLKQELYLGALATIEGCLLNQAPLADWGNIVRNLSGAPMQALEFCAEFLDSLADESELSPDLLDGLRADVDALVTKVATSQLDQEIKAHLIARLEELRHAILRYRLNGIIPIAASADAALGAAVLAYARTPEESKRAIVKDYLDIVHKVVALAEKAVAKVPWLKPAAAAAARLLMKGHL